MYFGILGIHTYFTNKVAFITINEEELISEQGCSYLTHIIFILSCTPLLIFIFSTY